MKKYISPIYNNDAIETKDIITTSFEIAEGTTPEGNKFVDAIVDISNYLNNLVK